MPKTSSIKKLSSPPPFREAAAQSSVAKSPGVVSPANDTERKIEVARALSGFLASTFALYHKSLFYHWNVTGPHFVSLHRLFEQHYKQLQKAGDTVAERLRALGYFAPGTLLEFIELSSLPEDGNLPDSDWQMIANLLACHESCTREAAEVLAIADEVQDEVTVDLMIERMHFHDKAAWMLRALQT